MASTFDDLENDTPGHGSDYSETQDNDFPDFSAEHDQQEDELGRDTAAQEALEAEYEAEEQAKKRKRNMNIVIAGVVATAVLFVSYKVISSGGDSGMESDPVFQGNSAYQVPNEQYTARQPQAIYAGQNPYGQSPQQVQPADQAPQLNLEQPGPQGQVAPQDPEAVQPQAAIPVQAQPQPVANQALVLGAGSNVTGNRLAELESKLAGVTTRVVKIEEILADHERRITALHQKPVAAVKPAAAPAQAAPASQTSSADATARRARQAAAIKAQQDAEKERLAKIQRDIEREKDETPRAPESKPVAAVVPKRAKPLLAAIVPGRAFLQDQDGVRADVALGDHVQHCGTVTKIDADKAEVVAGTCVIN
ncbi:hypothetical protein ACKF11_13470 [Methylobacillus sp. Pita2]|uniref:hypothetical protein n=1 Tax=Methylobacillus sp. Pita2 TaxID=3383245 RepID=UPI0038B678AF